MNGPSRETPRAPAAAKKRSEVEWRFPGQAMPLALLAVIAAGAASASPIVSSNLKRGAAYAQAQCQGRMHEDAYDYGDCIDALLAKRARVDAENLGMEFFAWVGAVNSSRMGLKGAEDAAFNYLRLFRQTQKVLGLSDAALCASVPGDCTARLARMRQMEAEAAAPAQDRK